MRVGATARVLADRALLSLRVRCRDVPGPDATWGTSGTAAPAVRAWVVVPDGSREVRLPLVPDVAGPFQQQLSQACHPDAAGGPGAGG